ncbi:hypothetical protein TKK_0013837 [Trichogramma kaykai]
MFKKGMFKNNEVLELVGETLIAQRRDKNGLLAELMMRFNEIKCKVIVQQPVDAIAALAEMMHDDDGDRLILSIDENEIENIQAVTEMNEIENISPMTEMLHDHENDLLLSDAMDYIEQQTVSNFEPIFPTTSENERQDASTSVVQEAQERRVDEEGNMHILEENINSEIPTGSSFDPIFPSTSVENNPLNYENERQHVSMSVVQEAQEWSVDEDGNMHMLEENINSEIPSTSYANIIQDRNDDFNQQVSSSSVSSHENIPLVILDSDEEEEESAGDMHRQVKPIHPFFGPYRRVTPQRPRILSDVILKTTKIRPLRVADVRTSARTRPYIRRNSNSVVEPNESPDIFGNLSNLGLQMGRGRSIPQRFVIVREEGRYYRRFRLRGTQMTIRFAQPPPTVNWLVHMEDTFEELHSYLASLGSPNDYIGVTITSDSLTNGSLWLSFRPVRDFTAEDLWEVFFNAAQSNENFSTENILTISCDIVKNLDGRGRVRLSCKDINKKSILTIRNDDNLCLPRSLVCAFAYVVRGDQRSGSLHDNWNKIRNPVGRYQREFTSQLIEQARVVIPADGCGFREIEEFQKYFAEQDTAIVIYAFKDFGRGVPPIYDGENYVKNLKADS